MTAATTNRTRSDRIAGAMFGGAVGDALGSAFEMLESEAIERAIGSDVVRDYHPALRGSLLYPRRPGQPTDDTAMALSLAFTLTCGEPFDADLCANRFLADLDRTHGRFGTMFWEGGPGVATMRALRALQRGAAAAANGLASDGGNGAAMRAHPAGCLTDRETVVRVAGVQARITHGHPAAVAAAQAVALLVHDGIAGVPASADVPSGIDEPTFVAAWQAAHRGLASEERLPKHLRDVAMSGWETVAAAHAISLISDGDPERAIGAAAASGVDTDTVACIVGAIVGARYGRRALPDRWLDGLDPYAAEACGRASELLV